MAFDQSKSFKKLEAIIEERSTKEFIYDFLLAFGSPKATITKLKNNLGSSGSVLDNELVLKNKIFYLEVDPGTDLHKLLASIKLDTRLSKDKIRFVLLTDFEDVLAYDLKAKDLLDIEFIDLAKNYAFFLPLAGIEKYEITSEHPADIRASYKMGQLCDVLRRTNEIDTEEKRHAFNIFLTRLLFCFYSEDTGIFSKNQMVSTITNTTDKSGKDLRDFFQKLFHVLNCAPASSDRKTLPNHLADFPYVNGGLFASEEWIPEFNNKARRLIIEIGALEWNEINPDIFGSMFQAVIDPEQRGSLGQHYTSVPNIMKVIEPLFLNDLREELDKSRKSPNRLKKLLLRLQRIRVFDPACGSGNFLIIAYKEIRLIEIDIFKALNELQPQGVMFDSGISLSQFYGIEIDDFAHEIALLSLWLAENQMNTVFEKEFGYREPMLPLKAPGNIVNANSLRVEWSDICPRSDDYGDLEIYTCGNPPFLGYRYRNDSHNDDMNIVFNSFEKYRFLDYVASWFWKASTYMIDGKIESAFVATNSICQGEQISLLWPRIFELGLRIHFAYTPFIWKNAAKSNAGVHVTIVGLSKSLGNAKLVSNLDGSLITQLHDNINPYLVGGPNAIIKSLKKPLSYQSPMSSGSYLRDGGNLILSDNEKQALLEELPFAKKWIRRLVGAEDMLNGKTRWCLWFEDESLEDLRNYNPLAKRLELVSQSRLDSSKAATREQACKPHLFSEVRQPKKGSYILVPTVSSEKRKYLPIGFFDARDIVVAPNFIIPEATTFEFGILTSRIHNDWMRSVAGRLKSDYRYSATLVYNTFPWPSANKEQKENIIRLSENILLIREDHPEKTLAQMYNPDTMPNELQKAHQSLDLAVEKLYQNKPFESKAERLALLFKRYEQLIAEEANNA